ncbi:NADH dehydrogenase [Domibacillus aminovorans]|uniref:NADH dehydrogenase n=1 Tax=Domibacillus aminovorans TaxID=29332 RepID=A0A177KJS8_9BACI|nr:FAD-dependent oxidoreductase [Domibacillus aminovorans]OAH52841.1 NADH dehydrogenase [Domibacillus aminovorans]
MRYVIIGGDAAGMSAAMQIVRNDQQAEITVLEKGPIYSYGQCGLPYVIGGLIESTEKLIARSVDTFRSKYGIDARILHEASSINLKQKNVSGTNHENGQSFTIPYDRLLIATGASPTVPKWEGATADNVHVVKTIPDTERLIQSLDDSVQDVAIIGAGYIGLELAENIHRLHKRIRIIQRSSHIAKMFDADMSKHLHLEAERHEVVLTLNEQIQAIEDGQIKTDLNTHKADLIIASVGIRPNTDFLKDTGMSMLDNGAIIVNDKMETSIPGIYAAGDCATHFHIVKQTPDYIPLGTTANKQGRIAGLNMSGKTRLFPGITGTSVMKFFDLIAASTGITENDAKKLEIPYKTSSIQTRDIAGYYPGALPLHIKLLYHPDTGLLLGGQAIGINGADKRIDVLATALFNKMTIEELEDLDLSYSPPVNGVWDPIQQVARRAK